METADRRFNEAPSRWFMPIILFTGLIALVFLGMYFFSSVTMTLLLPAILAYLFFPVVSFLERRGLPRAGGALLVVVLILGTLFFLLRYAIPELVFQLNVLIRDLPRITESLGRFGKQIEELMPILSWETIQHESLSYVESLARQAVSSVPALIGGILSVVYLLVIIPFLFFFFLKDGRMLIRRLVNSAPNRYFELTGSMVDQIDRILGRFLRGLLIENTIIGLLAITLLTAIGLPNAVLIGTLIGVFNVIPYMGPTIGYLLGGLSALMSAGDGPSLVLVIGAISIVQLADNLVVYPVAIGRSVDLHPVFLITSLLFGAFFYGIIGMLLAVPIVTAVSIIVRTYGKAVREFRIA